MEIKLSIQDCGGVKKARAVFIDGGISVEKFVTKDAGDELNLRYCLVRRMREAERDIAYQKHGDGWKEHVVWGRYWNDPTDEEKRLIDAALATV